MFFFSTFLNSILSGTSVLISANIAGSSWWIDPPWATINVFGNVSSIRTLSFVTFFRNSLKQNSGFVLLKGRITTNRSVRFFFFFRTKLNWSSYLSTGFIYFAYYSLNHNAWLNVTKASEKFKWSQLKSFKNWLFIRLTLWKLSIFAFKFDDTRLSSYY